MEKSSGLKECPRCGLRNRRGAYQCDFCGWDFKAASDDWMGKVSDLEKIGREVEVNDIDRSTRSKIELTIKKPASVPSKESKPEKQLEIPAHLTLEEHSEVITQTVTETYSEAEAETTPSQEDVVTEVSPPATETRPETIVPEKVEEVSMIKEMAPSKSINVPLMTSASLMGTGLVMYAVDLYLTMSHALGREIGWGIAIAASALISIAILKLLPILRNGRGSREEELILCPVCHEIVTEADAKCPSCGVKFKESPLRE